MIGGRRLSARLVALIVVNVILLCLYVWSRDGRTTVVRLEARGNQVTAYLDGRLAMQGEFSNIPAGAVMLATFDSSDVPSLPQHAGVKDITVRDLETGEIIFRDDFDDAGGAWSHPPPAERVSGGLLRTDGPSLTLVSQPLAQQDVSVTVRFANATSGVVGLGVQPGGAGGVQYRFDAFRDFRQILTAPASNERIAGPSVELAHSGYIKSMLAMALRPYPLVVGALALLTGIALAANFITHRISARARMPASVRSRTKGVLENGSWAATAGLAIITFATALVFIHNFQQAIPTWPDSTAYIFQAKIFASGHIAAPAPPVGESFDFFYPPLVVADGDRWAAIFPPGNAIVLAFGEVVGTPWIIPPLIGAAAVVVLMCVGSKMYGRGTGVLSAMVLAASPFYLMQSSNFMSHITAALFTMLSLLAIQYSSEKGRRYGALAGLAFGALFLTRPFTAALLGLPFFAALLLVAGASNVRSRPTAERAAAFAAALGAMLAIYLLFNFATTGSPFTSSYQESNAARLGFGGDHSVAQGLLNQQTHLAYLLLVFNAFPAFVGLSFVLVPLVTATNHRWDWFNAACALLVVSGAVLFIEDGTMQGPRLWFEAVPFLALLTARGAIIAGTASADLAMKMLGKLKSANAESGASSHPTRMATTTISVAVLIALLAYYGVYGWTFQQRTPWSVIHVPANSSELRGFNDIDDRMVRMLDEAQLENALVLVETCPHWQCYGSAFWLNTPTLDGDVVLARDLPEHNDALFAAFPDRRVFVASFDDRYIVPYGLDLTAGAPPGPPDQSKAPLARTLIATPSSD